MSQLEFVTPSGRPWKPNPGQEKPPTMKEQRPMHKGFVAVGHKPEDVAAAKSLADERLASWAALGDFGRKKALEEGRRAPKPFDLDDYLRKTKPSRVRHTPFGSPQAAADARDLAARLGWIDAKVIELASGE